MEREGWGCSQRLERNKTIKQVSELWRTHYLKYTQKKGSWKRVRRNAQKSRKKVRKAYCL